MRLAATVATDDEAEEFRRFLDREASAEEDRVIRRIALRGFADRGHRARAHGSDARNHHHGRGRLLASRRGRGRRPARHPGHFSARRCLRRGAPGLRPGRAPMASIGDDLQLRLKSRPPAYPAADFEAAFVRTLVARRPRARRCSRRGAAPPSGGDPRRRAPRGG